MTETFYDVLGVAEDATTDEIQSAYRERLKEVHPDVSDDEDAGQTTQQLVEARDVLVDEEERARYDRLGHESYVDGGASSVADAAAEYAESDDSSNTAESTTDGASRAGPRDRGQRERQASQRVREEQVNSTTSTTRESTGVDDTTTGKSDAAGYGPNGATVGTESTYSVRAEVDTSSEFGPILPTGERRTLLALFFALYPVLLFSALLPAFPLFVNLVVGLCVLVVIGYLQSMPRVALLVFGGWSVIGVTVLLLFGIDFFSLVGLAVLSGTVLPFGFSLLTAWALRY